VDGGAATLLDENTVTLLGGGNTDGEVDGDEWG